MLNLKRDYNELKSSAGVTELFLHNYRNYSSLNLQLEARPVVLMGPNGAGKTNLLEALSFLSPGRGLRSAKLAQVTNVCTDKEIKDHFLWTVSAQLDNDITLGTGLELTPMGKEKRIVKIQGEMAKSQSVLTEWLSVVWVTPQMDRLFLDASSSRRKFIDRFVYARDSQHAERVNRYDHALRERSTLLRENRFDELWVKTLEEKLSADGVAITIARRDLVNDLNASQYWGHGEDRQYPFPRFRAYMSGEIDQWIDQGESAIVMEERMAEKLKEARREDAATGGSSIGPHRSDLKVQHLAKNLLAEYCSTGEQKILLLAITLAFIKQEVPSKMRLILLLLDDVVAHLDFTHRMVLFGEISAFDQLLSSNGYKGGGLQTWMTGTDSSSFQPLLEHAQFFNVNNSTLTHGFY